MSAFGEINGTSDVVESKEVKETPKSSSEVDDTISSKYDEYLGSDRAQDFEYKSMVEKEKELDSQGYVDSKNIVASRDLDAPHFYNEYKKKEDFAALAERIPDVRDRLTAGESIESLCGDEELGDCANAYFKDDKMLTVRDNGDGSYQLIDDGNHRLKAAQDLGYEVPIKYEDLKS